MFLETGFGVFFAAHFLSIHDTPPPSYSPITPLSLTHQRPREVQLTRGEGGAKDKPCHRHVPWDIRHYGNGKMRLTHGGDTPCQGQGEEELITTDLVSHTSINSGLPDIRSSGASLWLGSYGVTFTPPKKISERMLLQFEMDQHCGTSQGVPLPALFVDAACFL